MEHAPAPLLARIANWSPASQQALWTCRTLFHDMAEQSGVGPLDETLKWQQPSWRPVKPRTGSTLRMGWTAGAPEVLSLFVDCKTDLAARMQQIYPDLPGNDGRREISLDLTRDLPTDPIAHLAQMTFTYHLAAHRKPAIG